jgi:hypothetical protein
MPKIYKYKIYSNQFAQGQLVSTEPIDGLFTTKQLFEYLNLQQVQLPQTLPVFRNNMHLFFETANEFAYEEVEPKKNFIPKAFIDKRNYTGFAVALVYGCFG